MIKVNEVSIVFCVKNIASILEPALICAQKNNPKEIIIIDGQSTDNTVEICRKYTDKIYSDPGIGFATARNIGVEKATGKYVFFVSPDNLLADYTIERLVKYMEEKNWTVAGILTRIKNPKGYIEHGNDFRFKVRVYPGECRVAGTPFIIPKKIFEKYKFDVGVQYREDAMLMDELRHDGYKIGRTNVVCYDSGSVDKVSTISRFKMYGKGDFQFFILNERNWTKLRKLRSIMQPIIAEIIHPISHIRNPFDIIYIPFLFWIATIRATVFWTKLLRYTFKIKD